jgi:hypothetical protein
MTGFPTGPLTTGCSGRGCAPLLNRSVRIEGGRFIGGCRNDDAEKLTRLNQQRI